MLQEGWNALLERHHRVSGEQWARCHQPSGRADARRERTQEPGTPVRARSEEHTSELQSLMRISYAVFCLKKKKQQCTSSSITSTQSYTPSKPPYHTLITQRY